MTIDELLERTAIVDVLNRYAQAIDRRDWGVARAAYHPDAQVDYGAYRGGVDGLFKYIAGRHEAIEQSMHFMGQTVVVIQGKAAFAVSPNIVFQRRAPNAAGPVAMFGDVKASGEERGTVQIGSRYLDRLENRGDGWKISSRTIVHEWMRMEVRDDRSLIQSDWQSATRDGTDPYFGFIGRAAG